MPLRVAGLSLPVGGDEAEVFARALAIAGIGREEVDVAEITRRSLDRRRKPPVFRYVLELHLKDEACARSRIRRSRNLEWLEPEPEPPVSSGERVLETPPVVVGTGPAGLFAAWHLARRGYRPLVLERGDPMNLRVRAVAALNRERVLDPESNYLFGEGGAGTFSDGKLTSRSKDPRARRVLSVFRELSGVPTVTYDFRPHLGSERVRTVVGRMRREIEGLGGIFRYRCRMESPVIRDGHLVAIRTTQGEIPAEALILAPGHSDRVLYRALLAAGVALERKPFQLGFRVEHPQAFVDRAVWGDLAGHPALGDADYRLSVRARGASVFSFCMCPGGEIIPAVSDRSHMNTNGMSHTGRSTGFANSGIVTTLEPEAFGGDGPLAGLELQERCERRAAELSGDGLTVPGQRLVDYLAGRPSTDLPPASCRTGVRPGSLAELLPGPVEAVLREGLTRLETQMGGFLQEAALLVGPECRSSSPVRIVRHPGSHASTGIAGLLPAGEGAGHAGGIVSAAVDGLRAAEALERAFSPVPDGIGRSLQRDP